jgi:predicted DNA repair protein MutK
MKFLSVVGTAAMFTVGGGILVHGVPALHHGVEHLAASMGTVPRVGGLLSATASVILPALLGLVAGAVVLLLVMAGQWLWRKARPAPAAALMLTVVLPAQGTLLI